MTPDINPDDLVENLDGLTHQESIFVMAFAYSFNATEAYLETKPDVKRDSARLMGHQMLARPHVRLALSAVLDERKKNMELDGRLILHNLLCVANASIGDLLGDDGEIDPLKVANASPELKRAIEMVESSYSKTGESKYRLKMKDSLRAAELIGKHLKLFTDKHEVSGPEGEPLTFVISFPEPKS